MQDLLRKKNLTGREKKNVFLAVACGCLSGISDEVPGPTHQKKKRVSQMLREELIRDVAPLLPRVADHNMDLFIDTIKASEVVLKEIIGEGIQIIHVLLNLAAFCMEELPVKDKHKEKLVALFGMWDDAYAYQDVRSGDRIFTRIETEVQILVIQRGGVLL